MTLLILIMFCYYWFSICGYWNLYEGYEMPFIDASKVPAGSLVKDHVIPP